MVDSRDARNVIERLKMLDKSFENLLRMIDKLTQSLETFSETLSEQHEELQSLTIIFSEVFDATE